MSRELKRMPTPEAATEKFHYDPETGEFRRMIGRRIKFPSDRVSIGSQLKVGNSVYLTFRLAWLMSRGEDPGDLFVRPVDGDETNFRAENLKLVTYSESQNHNSGSSWGPCLNCLRRLGFGLNVLSRIFGIDRSSVASKVSRFTTENRYTGFDQYRVRTRTNKISDAEAGRIFAIEWLKEIQGRSNTAHDQMYYNKYRHLLRDKPFTRRRARRQVRKVWYQQVTDAYALDRVGCTVKQFRAHIKKRLKKGWTEGNYGAVWNFDHVRPCVAFDLNDAEEVKKLNHFTNIRPMCVVENVRKGRKFC